MLGSATSTVTLPSIRECSLANIMECAMFRVLGIQSALRTGRSFETGWSRKSTVPSTWTAEDLALVMALSYLPSMERALSIERCMLNFHRRIPGLNMKSLCCTLLIQQDGYLPDSTAIPLILPTLLDGHRLNAGAGVCEGCGKKEGTLVARPAQC